MGIRLEKRLTQFFAVIVCLLLAACASSGPEPAEQKPIDKKNLSRIYTEKGAAYLEQGQPYIALKDLNKAIELDPGNAEAHGTLAVVYERLEVYDKARAQYRKAVSLDPDNPGLGNNFGRFLCARGEYEKGLNWLVRGANDKLYINRWIPMVNAGECALAAGDLEAAEKWLRQSLKLNPNSPHALAAMVRLKMQQKNYLSARAFLQRYEALVDKPEAAMLRLGYEIETQLGDQQAAKSYQKRLHGE